MHKSDKYAYFLALKCFKVQLFLLDLDPKFEATEL